MYDLRLFFIVFMANFTCFIVQQVKKGVWSLKTTAPLFTCLLILWFRGALGFLLRLDVYSVWFSGLAEPLIRLRGSQW